MKLRRLLLVTPVLAALSLPAIADEHHDHDHDHDHDRDHDRDHHDRDWHRDHRDFHGRDFRVFTPLELSLWTGGAWLNEWHGGRFGWWWVADGVWYWYPEPAYPYPTYVSEPVVVVQPPPPAYAPPPVAVVQPPPPPAYEPPPAPVVVQAPPPQEGAPPAQSWYYCDNPQGYYPYVQACASGWRPVPVSR
jgi:hypothetical protein